MSTRMIRTLAIAAGAGALVLSAAGPAMADETLINALPAKVSLNSATSDTARVALTGATCDAANWTWSTKVVGQRKGLLAIPAVDCTSGTPTWVITSTAPGTKRNKANNVVKFLATPTADNLKANPAAEPMVYSLVVKVNKTKGKPADTGKPA